MKVRISTRMKDGRILPWNGRPVRAEGTFVVFMKDRDGTSVPTLHVSGEIDPRPLYDARVISVSESYLLLAGLELVGDAWLKQEWKVEILTLQDDPPEPVRMDWTTRKERG